MLLGPASSAAARPRRRAGRGHRRRRQPSAATWPTRPPGHLTARDLAARAEAEGRAAGLDVEVLDEDGIAALRLGGLLGVNQGSTEPPRLVKLTYTPRRPVGTVALVGKGITYDSGGISLKPSERHARRHEDGHERRRRRAGGHDGAARHEAARCR